MACSRSHSDGSIARGRSLPIVAVFDEVKVDKATPRPDGRASSVGSGGAALIARCASVPARLSTHRRRRSSGAQRAAGRTPRSTHPRPCRKSSASPAQSEPCDSSAPRGRRPRDVPHARTEDRDAPTLATAFGQAARRRLHGAEPRGLSAHSVIEIPDIHLNSFTPNPSPVAASSTASNGRSCPRAPHRSIRGGR